MGVALVTGSSTGIGYAAALRLARDGHRVIATMRDPSACDLASVAEADGLDVELRALDVDEDGSVAEVFAAVGDVDILVNNAGIGGKNTGVEELALDEFRAVMETNYFGALRCIKAVLPSMRERGSGCIVNVTSQAGRLVMPSMGPYCGSKHALEAVSEALAIEMAPFGIRVAIVEPGSIMTAIWSKVDMTPPTGPYAPMLQRLATAVMHDVMQASSSDEVADCISEAITTDAPKLRWLTGFGAERNVARRADWTDEAYIELWNRPGEDAAFVAEFVGE